MFLLILSVVIGALLIAMRAVDYGVWVERDLDLEADAADVDREALLDAQGVTLTGHNSDVQFFLNIFGELTFNNQASIRTAGGRPRLQPLDEHGRPRPIKGRGFYTVGFPLLKAGTAEGYTFWTREQMTVKDYADSYGLMLDADVAWVRDQVLSPFFYDGAGASWTDEAQNESITVFGPANGDTVVFDKESGAATDDHVTAQANALGAGSDNPMTTIYQDLVEHPVNAGAKIVAFINSAQQSAMEALANFAPADRNLVEPVLAAGSATTDPAFAPPLGLTNLPSTMQYIGVHESTFVVVWSSIPANYMLTVAIGGQVKPLGIRQYRKPTMQGLVNVGEPMARFPYQANIWVRALGTGMRNRVGAHVHRFGNGTYATPAPFDKAFPLDQ